jgi:rfaE bifunctional protein kinase chain/domain
MTTREILAALPKLRVLVVGDICLDRWCTYDPALAEPSRETGIPRLGIISVETTPGAGGTIANNLAALGLGRVSVLGAIGNDGHGYELRAALKHRNIEAELLDVPGLQTFTYTKLLNSATGEEDHPRVDFVNTTPLDETADLELDRRLTALAPRFDIVIVSDQAETNAGGVVSPRLRDTISRLPNQIVWVDSRRRPEHFRNVIIKPNQDEAEAASLRALGRIDYPAFRKLTQSPLLVVTHGAEGVLLVNDDQQWVKTTPVANPVDICGAGDSFTAGASCALAVTSDPVRAAQFGNQVASVTIMKKGTGTASPEELL